MCVIWMIVGLRKEMEPEVMEVPTSKGYYCRNRAAPSSQQPPHHCGNASNGFQGFSGFDDERRFDQSMGFPTYSRNHHQPHQNPTMRNGRPTANSYAYEEPHHPHGHFGTRQVRGFKLHRCAFV
jgi:hypothetical protein